MCRLTNFAAEVLKVCVCVCVGVGGRVIVRIDSGITGEPVHFPSQQHPTCKELIRPITVKHQSQYGRLRRLSCFQ